ncbi:unnamed protein product, partial [Thlaspi arvense]
RSLWEKLGRINATTPVSRFPWAVVGDFNQILRSNQHSNHLARDVDVSGIEEFNLAIQEAEIFEAQRKDLAYTWWNNQEINPISTKIDHAFINQHLAQKFLNSFSDFLAPDQSDHASCFVKGELLNLSSSSITLWTTLFMKNLLGKLGSAWKSKAPTSLSLRDPSSFLSHGISARVKDQEAKLSALQQSLLTNTDVETVCLEHLERAKWHTLASAEEKYYRQKSRVQWHHLGARDTSFYHKTVIQRASRNHIHFLRDFNDRLIGSAEEINSHSTESMVQHKQVLVDYICCEICNGESASFWFDVWTDIVPLITFVGELGPRQMRIRKDARVLEATRNGLWHLPAVRSQEMEVLQINITGISPPCSARGEDCFFWRQANGTFGPFFSSKVTWEYLRTHSPIQSWHKNMFLEAPSGLRWHCCEDCLQRIDSEQTCVLCSSGIETHHHLFFECGFCFAVWLHFALNVWPNPPSDFHSAAAWITLACSPASPQASSIIKLIFQSAIYLIWKEKNAHIFSAISTSPYNICFSLDRLVRDCLLSIPSRSHSSVSMLEFYFSCIRPP